MNTAVIMGRICNDIELKYTQSTNIAVARTTIAVNRRYVKQGEERKADFIPVVFWNKQAEFVSKHFKKGSPILISGRIETGSYDDKDGKRVYTTEIIAETIDFCGDKKQDIQENKEQITDDELPF